jgi:hypothetical protein
LSRETRGEEFPPEVAEEEVVGEEEFKAENETLNGEREEIPVLLLLPTPKAVVVRKAFA